MKHKTVAAIFGAAMMIFGFASIASARLPGVPWNYDSGEITESQDFRYDISVQYLPKSGTETGISTAITITKSSPNPPADNWDEQALCWFDMGDGTHWAWAQCLIRESNVRLGITGLHVSSGVPNVPSVPATFNYESNGSAMGAARFMATRRYEAHVMGVIE